MTRWLLILICAALVTVAIQGMAVKELSRRARAAEQWKADAIINLGPYYRVGPDGKLAPGKVIEGMEAAMRGIQKANADISGRMEVMRLSLAQCDCPEVFFDDEFAGPETHRHGEAGEVLFPDAGPAIRLERKK